MNSTINNFIKHMYARLADDLISNMPERATLRLKKPLDNLVVGVLYELRIHKNRVDFKESDGFWYTVNFAGDRLHEFFRPEHEAFEDKMDKLIDD